MRWTWYDYIGGGSFLGVPVLSGGPADASKMRGMR